MAAFPSLGGIDLNSVPQEEQEPETHHQEHGPDVIGAVGATSQEKSPTNVEGNMSVAAVSASARYNSGAMQRRITEPLLEQDIVDHTTMVLQPQSCGGRPRNESHYNGEDKPHHVDTSDQSSKNISHDGLSILAEAALALDMSYDALPANASEAIHLNEFGTAQDATMVQEPRGGKNHMSSPQHEKETRGNKSETNHPPGNTTENTVMSEQQSGDKFHPEVSCADEVDQALRDAGSTLEAHMDRSGLNVQTTPDPHSGNVPPLHDKVPEGNYLSEDNVEKNISEFQKRSCSISAPCSSHDGDGGGIEKITQNKKSFGNSFSGIDAAGLPSMTDKMPLCTKNSDTNGSLGILSEQDLCIKCGKDGQLLTCRCCLLAAHDNCFGSSATFEDSGQFHCPVCMYSKANQEYQKAKRTYCEARKNVTAFLCAKQLFEQPDTQPTGVLPADANSKVHLPNVQSSHQTETDNIVHQDEEPDQPRKRQKINATHDACPKVVAQKTSCVQNSDVTPVNKHYVLQNNSKQVHQTEQEQQVENRETHEEVVGGNTSHETRNSSQNKCCPSSENQEVETDQLKDITNSHKSKDSDEIDGTSNESGKMPMPPWCNTRHCKAGFQDREMSVSSNSGKTLGHQDHHIRLPSGKRKIVYGLKLPIQLHQTGRRSKLCWTEEEEEALKEAMEKFTPRDNEPIPWIQIRDYGSGVFHRTRLPCDLRVKWRNMKKKGGS